MTVLRLGYQQKCESMLFLTLRSTYGLVHKVSNAIGGGGFQESLQCVRVW